MHAGVYELIPSRQQPLDVVKLLLKVINFGHLAKHGQDALGGDPPRLASRQGDQLSVEGHQEILDLGDLRHHQPTELVYPGTCLSLAYWI
jgi:hypothetical protein